MTLILVSWKLISELLGKVDGLRLSGLTLLASNSS